MARSVPIISDDWAANELVQTGLHILIRQPEKLLDGGLRSEDVIHTAGSSHATFYRKFATKSRYLEEVLRELVDTVSLLPADIRADVGAELDSVGGDRRRAVRALVGEHFNQIFNSNLGTRRLLATALGPTNSQTLHAIRTGYAHTDALILQLFEVLFARSGSTFRKPLNSRSFSVVLTALLDGFIIRHRAEPQVVTPELVADSILAVLNVAIDNSQRHGHIDDALSAIAPPSARAERLSAEPRAALIAAGRAEFTKRGYFGASIDTIASEAGVPLDFALRIFPTKAHLVVGGLKSGHSALGQGVTDDLSLGQDVISVVRNHFLRVARLVVAEQAFMDALIAAVAHDTYAEPDSLLSIKRELSFPALVAPVIARGQRDGIFSDDQPAEELAALLTDTLLLRCFTRRGNSPEENADFVFTLVLNGLRGDRRSVSDR